MLKAALSLITLLLLWNISTAQNVLDTKVQLSYSGKSVKSILKDIEKRYGFHFSYGKINLEKTKTFHCSGKLSHCLNELLAPDNIKCKLIANHIVLTYKQLLGRDIKGRIVDKDSRAPLTGASIIVANSDPLIGTFSDEEGYFRISDLPIGRYDFNIQYLGYEPFMVSQVLTSSGKEGFLNIEMQESIFKIDAVIVDVKPDPTKPINDMATTSARSFSVEETRRYAASLSDPARMVQSFAGVSSGGDDLSNEIIIRGNSARGILWKLEGVEIPNPNHFGGMGSGGGAISMLSASTLTNSDFYTGAFPAEYGNALSGVFDLRMRNGNKDKREHSIAIGNLGIEASTEGYFNKKSNASYLINYRYSTIELIEQYLPDLEGAIPAYRDLSFKINMPTKSKGSFSLFGLRGRNIQERFSDRDTSKWKGLIDAIDAFEEESVTVVGLTHRYLLSDKAYIQSSLAGSSYSYNDLTDVLNPFENFAKRTIDKSLFRNKNITGSFKYSQKINAKNKIRTGLSLSYKNFRYDYFTILFGTAFVFFENSGNTQFLQSYFQWQHRFNEKWELNAGVNFSYLFLNGTYGIDPRAALSWQVNKRERLAISMGLHSKPEHLSTYFIERNIPGQTITTPNKNLSMLKAFHLVLGYDYGFSNNVNLRIESYFQQLFDIPVSSNPNNGFSVLNVDDVFDIINENDFASNSLVSDGTGKNYGIDFTLEKPLSNDYYFLFTGSFFKSVYSAVDQREYPTISANKFLLNLLSGKEWKLGKRKNNIIGINGKLTFYGGNRDTPINLDKSIETGREVLFQDRYNEIELENYFRIDLGISYKINTKNTTHSIHLDIQNLSNRFNVSDQYYDRISETIKKDTQNGFIPFVYYRIQISK